ncbi:MAG: AAA family ATPase [Rhodothermales bacterium]|nr:AAA family ATPase [Rhodothermales bacterium]
MSASTNNTTAEDANAALERMHRSFDALKAEVAKKIIGQDEVIKMIIVCLLCRGHALLVGVPGLAKTLLIRTLADALDLEFNRIQFTPDLMPSDITGTEILEEDAQTGKRHFRFVHGPLFANVVLADEINRTPPKTQAALLEAMQERHITASGHTYELGSPFFVLATQNPIEQEGTYPLPEAQLDRFMLNLWLDYPSFEEEVDVVRTTTVAKEQQVNVAMSGQDLVEFQHFVRTIPVADNVIEYAVSLVGKTRPDREGTPEFISNYLSYGAGPRASQYLIMGAKALAALDGRLTPVASDVDEIAFPVLRHRIVTNFNADAEGITAIDMITRLLAEVSPV